MNAARALIALGGDKDHQRSRIADIIKGEVKDKRRLPTADAVRRRLHLPGDTATSLATTTAMMNEFLRLRRSKVEATTLRGYEAHNRLYISPYLGDIPPDDMSVADIAGMYEGIDEFNDTLTALRSSPDPAQRESVKWRRPVGTATKHRIRATLRAAINMFIRQRLLTFNPAAFIELPTATRPKPLIWTPGREAAWREAHTRALATARPRPGRGSVNPLEVYISTPRPSTVMVWAPWHVAAFLEHARSHRLYALFRLVLLRGTRRGESVGLRRAQTHPAERRVEINWQITQLGWTPLAKAPKSEASDREFGLDDDTAYALAATLIAQDHEREAAGSAWNESGYTFTDELGNPYHPQHATDEFYRLSHEAGLPPIQLHGARHTAACLMHAAGADLKDIQETLGHSSLVLTGDTYTTLLHSTSTTTAQATAQLINAARLS